MASLRSTTVLLLLPTAAFISAPPGASAITCGEVSSDLAPCVSYVLGTASLAAACCSGVPSLSSAAATTVDRQTACNCIKSFTGRFTGLKPGLAAGLPRACGVSVPYPISSSTDCSSIQ